MDVIFFLKERTGFIRQLYSTTSAPYIERMQKIENEEEPFAPLYSGGEPFFQKEFNEATESLNTLRLMYISMLKSALHSYLDTWITGFQLIKNYIRRYLKIKDGSGVTAVILLIISRSTSKKLRLT